MAESAPGTKNRWVTAAGGLVTRTRRGDYQTTHKVHGTLGGADRVEFGLGFLEVNFT